MSTKVAVVTGGSRGIGRSIVEVLARDGYEVHFTYNSNEAKAHEVEAAVAAAGGSATCHQLDVSSAAATAQFFEKVLNEAGHINLLVNNAGITKDALLLRMSTEDFTSVIDTNLTGAYNCLKAASAQMLKQRSGVIINISSVVGVVGNPGQVNYAASKAGLIAMTKSAAKELGSRNIRVVAVAPGFIETEMTDVLTEEQRAKITDNIALRRLGASADVAELVSFLASEKAGFITGQVFVIDGGMI